MTGPVAGAAADAPGALAAASRRLGVPVERSAVEEAFERAGLGRTIRQIEPLAGGHVNALLAVRLADGGRWVLKLGHPVFRPGKLLNEARALGELRDLGLPMPRLVRAETRGGALPVDWLIQEHVDGRPLGEALAAGGPAAPELTDLMAAAGRWLATIHRAAGADAGAGGVGDAFGVPDATGAVGPIPWFGQADPTAPRGPFPTFAGWLDAELREQLAGIGDDRRFRGLPGPLAAAIRALGRRVGELSPGRVHGDFTAANLLVAPGRSGEPEIVALLDCEWSHRGARELELIWAWRSFARVLAAEVREEALEGFQRAYGASAMSPMSPISSVSPALRRLADGLVLLYELNAFDWIAAPWPATRRAEELERRLAAARRLVRAADREEDL